jgi:PAS domain S-box-containing protein
MQSIVRKWLDSCGPLGEADAEANESPVGATSAARQTGAAPAAPSYDTRTGGNSTPATRVAHQTATAPAVPVAETGTGIGSTPAARVGRQATGAPAIPVAETGTGVNASPATRTGRQAAATPATPIGAPGTEVTAPVARTGRSVSAGPSTHVAASNAKSGANSAEQRLKLIIEAAPVSLMVIDRSGQVLAANRAALASFGVEQLTAIVGMPVGTLIAPEDRESFTAFVAAVCGGKPGSLEYDVLRPEGSHRRMETHAVAIRRGDDTAAAFLGATWDVTDRDRTTSNVIEKEESNHALLEAERDALKEALQEAKRTAIRIDRDGRTEQERLKAALAEASQRQGQLETAWAAERESLMRRAQKAEERQAALSRELGDERQHVEMLLADADRKCQEAVASAEQESARLRGELRTSAQLLSERDQWRPALTNIVRAMTDSCEQAKRLIDNGPSLRLVSSTDQDQANTQGADVNTSAEPESDHSWQF